VLCRVVSNKKKAAQPALPADASLRSARLKRGPLGADGMNFEKKMKVELMDGLPGAGCRLRR
jgi:hypothetical protein